MKSAVSNIAWDVDEDAAALARLETAAIEAAPTRWWPDLMKVTREEALARADKVCGFQALLFGRPELQVFGPDQGRACLDYLARVCDVASWCGARTLVFGSPRNRIRGTHDRQQGTAFFRELGNIAAERGVVICVEANPAVYGGDYLLTSREVAELVAEVDSPGVRMNLDTGELTTNGGDVAAILREVMPLVTHVHVSEPFLAPLNPANPVHEATAEALRGYQGFVSLEMKAPEGGLPVVEQCWKEMLRIYFPEP
ncbi:MAG: sugar phosphate isomerase/epimerase [Verrucomicrobiaceae bacterium]|nr:sugar phosphate isomerase/epimerase [Verrucomicrobiaceae bacterium]